MLHTGIWYILTLVRVYGCHHRHGCMSGMLCIHCVPCTNIHLALAKLPATVDRGQPFFAGNACYDIYILRYTVFGLKQFLNDDAPQLRIVEMSFLVCK